MTRSARLLAALSPAEGELVSRPAETLARLCFGVAGLGLCAATFVLPAPVAAGLVVVVLSAFFAVGLVARVRSRRGLVSLSSPFSLLLLLLGGGNLVLLGLALLLSVV